MSNVKDVAQIPFYAHEGEVTRLEKINKRLWIAVLVIFAAFVVSNLAWIIYENQFEDEVYTYEVQQDSGDGGTNTFTDNKVVMGGDSYGEPEGASGSQTQGNQNQ